MKYTLLALLLLVGCRRNEICYDEFDAQVPVRIDLLWTARPALPSGFYACFYPLEARPFVDYLDTYGGVLNLTPSHYSVVTFSNDTEKVRFRNTTTYETFEAYVDAATRPSLTAGAPMEVGIAEPDRLFAASVRDVEVAATGDTVVIEKYPQRLFAVYPFEVSGLTGVENLSAIRASVSGMAPSVFLASGELGANPSTVFLNFRRTADGIEGGFSTFGHYADPAVRHIFTLELLYQGRVTRLEYDVTEMLHTTDRISIVERIDFPPVTGGGGFDTGVGGWGDDVVDVPI